VPLNAQVWDFPRYHQLKAICLADVDLMPVLESLLTDLALRYRAESFHTKTSRNGKYISGSLEVFFTTADEVEQLYRGLHEHPLIVQSL